MFSLRQSARRTTIDSFDNNSESENDAQSDLYTINIPEEVEDEAISDNENLTDSEGEPDDGGSSTENEPSVDIDDEVEEGVDGECAQDDDEQLAHPNNVRYLVFQLIKRIRACISNIRATRVVNDYIKIKAQSNDPPIKSRLITDFEIRWNTTFIMLDRFTIYRPIIDDINSRPFKIAHTSSAQQLKLGSKEFEFTNNDWCRITDLHTILKPFMIATNVVSAKNYPTLAATYSGEFFI